MSMRCVFGFRVMVVGIAGFLAGCGGSSVPTLAPVSGTIQMAGAPAEGVTVMFTPTGSTKTAGAFGVTGPDGKYELVHRSGERGIEPAVGQEPGCERVGRRTFDRRPDGDEATVGL